MSETLERAERGRRSDIKIGYGVYQTSLRLAPSEYTWIERRSLIEGKSRAAIIRRLIRTAMIAERRETNS